MPRRVKPRLPKPDIEAPPQGDGAPWVGGKRIPRPPSLNRLYRIGKNKQTGKRTVIKSAAYSSWLVAVGWMTKGQLPAIVRGPYEMVLLVGRRKGSDLDNCAKAICDWLKETGRGVGVVEDDSLCECLTLKWCDDLNAKEAAFFIRPVVRVAKREAAHAASR